MKFITGVKTFFKRQSVIPFEVVWGFYVMYAGAVLTLNYGVTISPLSIALGTTIAMIFNIVFFVSGAGIFFGVGWRKGNVEAFGVILLATSLLVRTIAAIWFFGITPMMVNGIVLNGGFIIASIVRLQTIFKSSKRVDEFLHKTNG